MLAMDTNSNVANVLPQVMKRGFGAVGRYYSSNASKRLTATEAQAISAAGLKIFTVFEDTARPALNFHSGVHDASIAVQQARDVKQPAGSAIYFALDSELDVPDLDGVRDYFKGIRQTIAGNYKLGVYADGVVCKALLDEKICDFAWLSASRGFPGSRAFLKTRRWALAQDPKIDQDFHGHSIDVNEINGDFGGFHVAAAAPQLAAVEVKASAVSPPPTAPVPATGAGGWSGTISCSFVEGALQDVLAVPARSGVAVAALSVPQVAKFTVHQGRRYRATVRLSGFEQLASNAQIVDQLTQLGFRDATVTGSGGTRVAEGLWTGPDTTAQLDPHLSDVVELS
jgi:hypothetical protein